MCILPLKNVWEIKNRFHAALSDLVGQVLTTIAQKKTYVMLMCVRREGFEPATCQLES